MGILGFGRKKKKFFITEEDQDWVISNFKWLFQIFGTIDSDSRVHLLNEHSFPKTLSTHKISVDNIIQDISTILDLDPQKINHQFKEDLRDFTGTPYEIEGPAFESEVLVGQGVYKIFIANSLIEYPNRLILNLIINLVRIKLIEGDLDFDTGEDTDLFLYLAGSYFGFGVVLSNHLSDKGKGSDGLWEWNWNYTSEIHENVMAYALAIYSKLRADSPTWKNELTKKLEVLFDSALEFIENDSSTFNGFLSP